jgi:hypothetical protein
MLIVLAGLAGACSGGAEQQILNQYFSAARLRDSATLSNIATVQFNPDTDGTVQDFSVTSVGEEQTRAVPLRELRKTFDDVTATEQEFTKKMKEYQDANIQVIDRVLRAERTSATLRGRDLEVQTAWSKWREDMARHAKTVNEARSQLAEARSSVEASVFNPSNPVDVTGYDGMVAKKEVTIDAEVRSPSGETTTKALVVTLERATLKNEQGEVNGRWIITGIRPA